VIRGEQKVNLLPKVREQKVNPLPSESVEQNKNNDLSCFFRVKCVSQAIPPKKTRQNSFCFLDIQKSLERIV